jgi:hypothetical protein
MDTQYNLPKNRVDHDMNYKNELNLKKHGHLIIWHLIGPALMPSSNTAPIPPSPILHTKQTKKKKKNVQLVRRVDT